MKQYLSWTQGRRDQGGVESLCLYVARFDPSAGTQVAHLPIECATVETLVTCLNANPADAAEVWRRLHPSSRCGARREGHEGHDAPCYYCGHPCNTYAGNPGLWPLGFTHADEPGVVKWHHTGCVQGRLRELEKIRAEVAETWDVVGGPPEHPEEDPEVSTLPAAVRVTVEYEREQLALAREHLKIAEQERDEYKLTTETIKAALFLIDATAEETVAEIRALKKAESRDGAALEKVRKLLGTTVAAESAPSALLGPASRRRAAEGAARRGTGRSTRDLPHPRLEARARGHPRAAARGGELRLRSRASERRWVAIKKLAPWLAGGAVAVLGTILIVHLDWKKPRHEHVMFEGQAALRTSCDSSNNVAADCRAEAANECRDRYTVLSETSVHHPASVAVVPIPCGNNCVTVTTVTTPEVYRHFLTYRCEVP
ncbi:MAG: hypothetical protein DYH12_35775 [Sorangiineae bacterium PRO1]|nr:hypothetical protein [Sorangiineae bacterium PRO1]